MQGQQLVVYGGEANKGHPDDARSGAQQRGENATADLEEEEDDDSEPIADVCCLDGQAGQEHFWVTLPMNGALAAPPIQYYPADFMRHCFSISKILQPRMGLCTHRSHCVLQAA